METSKKILCASWAAAGVLTGLTVCAVFRCVDASALLTLAGLAWAELTAAHGFYLWKAKNENRSKHAMQLVRDLAKDYGIDNAARIAEIVLKE